MSEKLTRWFPHDVKPAHDGVYQIRFRDGSGFGEFAYFSNREKAEPPEAFCLAYQYKIWRGLAEKP